ncbi:putative intracellular septation protein [Bradyrhizobium sp. ORS 285]|uniref:septation protein IspZ n=1 Tax=Bradyrhizobium sp. ORS 285 TaxID=115808 RepID=UPI000240615E|nr:septation protein IspZ [Bradyrhizobium sp. ORS 285]CCD84826.1 putative intracellular septation protein [Bradyrhizobium sp. ORS 285]SMX57364.1 putative intracellular septation protein [Bradyrhizobium sp. ORS 285]
MRHALIELCTDFLSAIVFFVLTLATGSAALGSALAIAVAIAQLVHARMQGRPLNFMTQASLALVVVLGAITLLTDDPRFMFAKPAIGHFAVGLIMLKRGWMLRYVPAIVTDNIPGAVTVAGYAWAALMFALGLGTIAVALTGDLKMWALYISVVAVGAKIAAFAIQFVTFRVLVRRRIRAARVAAGGRPGLLGLQLL